MMTIIPSIISYREGMANSHTLFNNQSIHFSAVNDGYIGKIKSPRRKGRVVCRGAKGGVGRNRVVTPFDSYLREIDKVPLLTRDEEIYLAGQIATGNAHAREQMLRANLRLVVSIARQYKPGNFSLQDLVQEGNIGLMKAVKKFDPNYKTKFSTYATYWIKQAIRGALRDKAKLVYVPGYLVQAQRDIAKISARCQTEHKRAPTVEELAEELFLKKKIETHIDKKTESPSIELLEKWRKSSVKRMKKWLINIANIPSLTDQNNDESSPIPLDMAVSPAKRPHSRGFYAGLTLGLRTLIDTFEPREQTILIQRFGLGENSKPLTYKEIGERLGLSRERVRQIETELLKKLRAAGGSLEDFVN